MSFEYMVSDARLAMKMESLTGFPWFWAVLDVGAALDAGLELVLAASFPFEMHAAEVRIIMAEHNNKHAFVTTFFIL
jgi:hypothetical protein